MNNVITMIPLHPNDNVFYAHRQAQRLGLHLVTNGCNKTLLCSVIPKGFTLMRVGHKAKAA